MNARRKPYQTGNAMNFLVNSFQVARQAIKNGDRSYPYGKVTLKDMLYDDFYLRGEEA